VEGNYFPISSQQLENGLAVYSEVLGLELQLDSNGKMRFFDPTAQEKLRTPQETEEARLAEQNKARQLAERLRELGVDPEQL